jgi:cysteinyl-tRNA synthetase
MGLLTEGLGGWDNVDLSVYETALTEARATAMATKDFTEVDRLKTALLAAGVEVRMSKEGVSLSAGTGFDPAALEGLV